MLLRTRNAIITLLAVLLAYQGYTLSIGPLLAPPTPVLSDAAADDPWNQANDSVARYQRLLANYFPAGHWSLTGSPKVLEHAAASVLLVYGDLSKDRFGRVDVTNTALVYFPTPRVGPGDAPPDAIVIDAPGVAKLQFDEAFNPTGGEFGWPKRGLFEGELTIRSGMAKPGPDDDLFVRTRDLRLEGLLITSDSAVEARLGRSEATGRVLEIELLEDPYAAPDGFAATLGVAGVSSIEVRHDVRAKVLTASDAAASPGTPPPLGPRLGPATPPAAAAAPAKPVSPIFAECDGSFRFDFTTFAASLNEQVRVRRPRPGLADDTLVCDELRASFGDTSGRDGPLRPADEPDFAESQGRALSDLAINHLEAIGAPAKLESPSVLGAAEGARIHLWLRTPRVRVEGSPDRRLAMVAYGLNEARGAWIDYESPPESSGRTLGTLSMAGPGWMRVATRAGDPTRLVEARWEAIPGGDGAPTESVRLIRDTQGNPLLIAEGSPEIAAAGVGWLKAKRIEASLLELDADGKRGPVVETPGAGGDASRGFLVRTVNATGGVDFRGAELEGKVDSLTARFRPAEGNAPRSQTASLTNAPGARNDRRSEDGRSEDGRYRVTGKTLELDVALRGRRAEPLEAVCLGDVELRQLGAGDRTTPLTVRGQAMRVRAIAEPGVQVIVSGANPQTGTGPQTGGYQLAEVHAAGVDLWGRDLRIDQQAGRAWIDGPGNARLELNAVSDRGSPFGSLGPEATLRWKDGLELRGDTLTATGEVRVDTQQQWIHCAQLAARLTAPIDFRRGVDGRVQVGRIDCGGGVSIDHRTSDVRGQTSHQRLQLRTLGADLRTGELQGQGPGWVRSVHLPTAAKQTAGGDTLLGAASAADGGLRLLRVDFRRGVSGNLNSRVVRFHQRVSALYTPVLAWDDHPPPVSASGPPPGAVTLACDELRLSEDPAARFAGPRAASKQAIGPIEAKAVGGVRIEGRPEGSTATTAQAFAAEAVVASYSQLKEVFVLEGDNNRNATIWRQAAPGRQPERVDGRKLLYWPKLNKFKYEDVRGGSVFGAAAQPDVLPTRR